ncbi:MAG: FecR domain-containing protein [Verrucomicrobiae bacterium]|nr:FecR domain-containing protein [Verrucomicrobiae bacterium]NNJ86745.1 hypothetical protein [Akkermansiaceae bacterium]
MNEPDFDQHKLRRLMAEALDGEIDEAGRRDLNKMLEASAGARCYYRELMDLHARLHLEYNSGREVESMPGSLSTRPLEQRRAARRTRLTPWLAAAAAIVLLAVFAWRDSGSDPQPFATLETTHSAQWGGGNLATSMGSRLGAGKLRLEQGVAVIRFDSGAEVSLEAPVEFQLIDAMNCRVSVGTAVANVPDSATGFRIETPSAMVIDYGTRFSVSVDSDTGSTLTQVFEGLVDVENPTTGDVVSLRAGQHNSVAGLLNGPVIDGFNEKFRTRESDTLLLGSQWTTLESCKDAYTGYPLDTDSEQLLYVKHGQNDFHRKAYMGFDLSGVRPDEIGSARLVLQFEPTGLGLASHVPDATFGVYGLLQSDIGWDETKLRRYNAPANIKDTGAGLVSDEVNKLGSFVVKQGVQLGSFGIDGEALADFLREHAGTTVTLVVVRETAEIAETGLVHGIVSRRHPFLPGPTLAICPTAP